MTGSPLTDLVANSFGAAPFQEDLLYSTGTGHAETLRTLQFRPGFLGSISERCHSPSDRMVLWISGMKVDVNGKCLTYFAGSVFILSKRALLAWAPLDRGSVWDFIRSCLKSAQPDLSSFLSTGKKHTNKWTKSNLQIQQILGSWLAAKRVTTHFCRLGENPDFMIDLEGSSFSAQKQKEDRWNVAIP